MKLSQIYAALFKDKSKVYENFEADVPLFDWRDFKKQAKAIIEDVKRPIQMFSVRGERTRKGVDLKECSEDLAKHLAEMLETYEGAKANCEMMAMPKPRKRPTKSKRKLKPAANGYDYSGVVTVEEIEAEWDRLTALFPSRRRGNPSTSRDDDGFFMKPLYPIYWATKDWWDERAKIGFTPSFEGGDSETMKATHDGDPEAQDEMYNGHDFNNAPSRVLLGVFQFVEPRCKAKHALSIYERLRHHHKKHDAQRANIKKARARQKQKMAE